MLLLDLNNEKASSLFPFFIDLEKYLSNVKQDGMFASQTGDFASFASQQLGLVPNKANRWAANQYITKQSLLQPDLFISNGFSKSLLNVFDSF